MKGFRILASVVFGVLMIFVYCCNFSVACAISSFEDDGVVSDSECMVQFEADCNGADLLEPLFFINEKIMEMLGSSEILLTYNVDIMFELNSVEVNLNSYPTLDRFVKIAELMDGVYIHIEGNAAKRAEGITDEEIISFSLLRADAVAAYFISQGIPAERIIVSGNGDFYPLNEDNLSAPENRRTDISFKTEII